ncbi:MAG TPA: hypothetical protein VHZ30_07560 [Verrucomicrobiae bacterium]|jgi:hypothetical protein|nr:hypothetical protein [Verrucomicrobiae bacterium]
MTNTSALVIPAQSPAATNAAPLVFHDTVKPLIEIANVWLFVFWVAAILAIGAIAWFLWRRSKAKKAQVPAIPLIPAHVRARRMLEEALAFISEPKPFSIAVSGAIRVYLEERFNFHAPDRTTEEFLYELQGTDLLLTEQKQSLGEFLENCDLIKFAKYEPTETELRALHTAALRLVNETEPKWTGTQVLSPQIAEASAEK